jgi:hypothetical protein
MGLVHAYLVSPEASGSEVGHNNLLWAQQAAKKTSDQ